MVRPVPALGLKAALSAGRRPRLLAALVLLRHRLVQARHHTTTRQRHILQEHAEVVVVAHGKRHRAGRQALRLLCLLARRLHGQLQQLGCTYSSTAAMYTAPDAPMRRAYWPRRSSEPTRPTGKARPAFAERPPPCFLDAFFAACFGVAILVCEKQKTNSNKVWLGSLAWL
ncbi:hypothetical protein TcBrA4_0132810 [Trypanosoma cruzi]|nr:hypothetical protein TcBrA4_0132810 [Trypanosoma cruzi]